MRLAFGLVGGWVGFWIGWVLWLVVGRVVESHWVELDPRVTRLVTHVWGLVGWGIWGGCGVDVGMLDSHTPINHSLTTPLHFWTFNGRMGLDGTDYNATVVQREGIPAWATLSLLRDDEDELCDNIEHIVMSRPMMTRQRFFPTREVFQGGVGGVGGGPGGAGLDTGCSCCSDESEGEIEGCSSSCSSSCSE